MNHSEVKKQLPDYLEGELDLAARALVDAHLDECADCGREVSEMQQTIRLLRMLPEPEQPPMVAANVMRRIRAGETEPGFFERIGRTLGGIFEPSFVLPASAVAAAAFVVVVVQEPGGLSAMLEGVMGPNAGPSAWTAEQGGQGAATGTSSLTAVVPTPFTAPASARPSLVANGVANGVANRAANSGAARSASGGAGNGLYSPPRSYGAPAAQDFLVAKAQPRVYSDVGVDPSRAAVRVQTRNGARRGQAGAVRVPARIQVDRDGRPLATVVDQASAGSSRTFNPSGSPSGGLGPNRGLSDFGGLGNALAGSAVTVAGPGVGRSASGLRAHGLAPASAPQARGASGLAAAELSSGGEDVRDLWLARGLEDPVGFANFIAERNLAEQELFVSRLSERANERGMLAALLTALRASGDETAAWVADDFAAERPN